MDGRDLNVSDSFHVLAHPISCAFCQLALPDELRLPKEVPTTIAEQLGSPYSAIINEVIHSPSYLRDVTIKLLELALSLDTGSVSNSACNVSKEVTLLVTRITWVFSFVYNTTLPVPNLHASPTNRSIIGDACRRLHDLLRRRNGEMSALTMFYGWLNEIERCMPGLGSFQSTKSGLSSPSTADKDCAKKLTDYTHMACDLHARILCLYQDIDTEVLDFATCQTILNSYFYLSIKHTWNTNLPLGIPDTDIFSIMQSLREKLVLFLNKCIGKEVPFEIRHFFSETLQQTYIHCIGTDNIDQEQIWCAVEGDMNQGRFVTSRYPSIREVSKSRIPLVKEGVYPVEIDLQTLELRIRGTSLRALDSDIANNEDVEFLFGKQAGMIQCTEDGTYEHKKSRYLVGLGYQLELWRADKELKPMYDNFDREYDPSELFQSEEWVADIFEPVRREWFCRPKARDDVPFFLTEEQLRDDTTVAMLVASHPQHGRTWFEVFVFKSYRMVHAYIATSHGRRYYRSLCYATDYRFCLRDLQPSTKDRDMLWPSVNIQSGVWQWGRYEAHDAEFPDYVANLKPPPHPASCVVQRPLADPTFFNSNQQAEERNLVYSIMAPLITILQETTAIFGEIETSTKQIHRVSPQLFQRACANLGQLQHAITIAEQHEYFRELDDEDEESTSMRGGRAGPAQRLAISYFQAVSVAAKGIIGVIQNVYDCQEKKLQEKNSTCDGDNPLDDIGMEEEEKEENNHGRDGSDKYILSVYKESWDDLRPHDYYYSESYDWYMARMTDSCVTFCSECDENIPEMTPFYFDNERGKINSTNSPKADCRKCDLFSLC